PRLLQLFADAIPRFLRTKRMGSLDASGNRRRTDQGSSADSSLRGDSRAESVLLGAARQCGAVTDADAEQIPYAPDAIVSAPIVVGDGMIGRSLAHCFPDDPAVTFYAAGVSDSTCTDSRDFARDVHRLRMSLDPERLLVYFSSCALAQPKRTMYLSHKEKMESIVREQPKWLILRLPNVVGRTPNPHTLFNHLYAR